MKADSLCPVCLHSVYLRDQQGGIGMKETVDNEFIGSMIFLGDTSAFLMGFPVKFLSGDLSCLFSLKVSTVFWMRIDFGAQCFCV